MNRMAASNDLLIFFVRQNPSHFVHHSVCHGDDCLAASWKCLHGRYSGRQACRGGWNQLDLCPWICPPSTKDGVQGCRTKLASLKGSMPKVNSLVNPYRSVAPCGPKIDILIKYLMKYLINLAKFWNTQYSAPITRSQVMAVPIPALFTNYDTPSRGTLSTPQSALCDLTILPQFTDVLLWELCLLFSGALNTPCLFF